LAKTTDGLFSIQRKLETKHYNYLTRSPPSTYESFRWRKYSMSTYEIGLLILPLAFFAWQDFEIKKSIEIFIKN
jgi:hypothetical protein